jgi:predicted RND superfamily exporter protein
MIGNLYFKISKRIRILVLFIIIVFIAYFILRFLSVEPKNIPADFLEARQDASLIAQDIVSLSGQSVGSLDEIANLDKEGKYTEALVLVSQELERNRQAREKAIRLSAQLEIMANNLGQIAPASAGQIALEAISSETALISRLISHNDYLTQLLEVLRQKFLGKADGDKIPELIVKINNEVQAINDLNRKFNDLMKEFDNQ